MINLKNLIDFLPFEYKDQDTYKVMVRAFWRGF